MLRYLFCLLLFASCLPDSRSPRNISSVRIEPITTDSINVRSITIMEGNLGYAGAENLYGIYLADRGKLNASRFSYDSLELEFRAVASTSTDFFMLSIGNPALLFKTGDSGNMELVYKEEHPSVFYDAMRFWNDEEGIAMGDPTGDCISVIITRDGGNTWVKLPCENLPVVREGEAAFAASNTNIAIAGDQTWIATGGISSRIYYSPDKGRSWEVYDTPVIQGNPTQGIYSIDFYDEMNGFAMGGDYTDPDQNLANKARTVDGGKTWELVAEGEAPGYLSCVQYVPGRGGAELVATGKNGVFFSNDHGSHWNKLTDQGFYTLRFVNDTMAYAAGNNIIAKLFFKEK
ncbi:WD40/YVTN/BNR-like repeat-containing protein [Robertkochia aurantiaca]|uniref:WD40/YVTN/BNR-like repeat-containing protein n=1 Tax=Robertkochia aurantiaca TaxID=2873700 RepID=UPI001CCA3ADB|nr:oxidoreductase [Robertkochia sp. 3YJGBD-33]